MTSRTFALAIILLMLPDAQGEDPLDSALNRFLGTDPSTFAVNLERLRPAAVTAEIKARALASLPPEGEVKKLKESAWRKLAAVEQVLRFHGRDAVYEIKVIDVPQAFVGLHARAVVLISETALNLLDPEELQAQVAHEVGHEYVWSQYEMAGQRKDFRLLQELELFCDGVAIVTLRRAGVDPSHLASGLEKVIRYNRERLGRADNEGSYPSLAARKKFAREIFRWLER